MSTEKTAFKLFQFQNIILQSPENLEKGYNKNTSNSQPYLTDLQAIPPLHFQ